VAHLKGRVLLPRPLTIAILLAQQLQDAAVILVCYNIMLYFSFRPWARSPSPRPPDTPRWGGSRLTGKIARPLFHFNRQTIVAMALRCAGLQDAAD
jgi:hypothetical protein